MTKKILLALALTLGTASVAVPQASACGGYAPESPEQRAVRETVEAYGSRRAADGPVYVYAIRLDGRRASAHLRWSTPDGRDMHREVRLRERDGAWRVVSVRVG
jgi:hypothetical protein